MKSFFDKKKEEEKEDKTLPFRTQAKEAIKTYFDLSKLGINYCRDIDGNEIHLMTEEQLQTKCGKVFTEGHIYPAWMIDIDTLEDAMSLITRCPLCFQENKRRQRK